jgi:hypothetical protein
MQVVIKAVRYNITKDPIMTPSPNIMFAIVIISISVVLLGGLSLL